MALKIEGSSGNKDKFNIGKKISNRFPEIPEPRETKDLKESRKQTQEAIKQTDLSKDQTWYGKWTFVLTALILILTVVLVLNEYDVI